MATKDPHIAVIDARERLEMIRQSVLAATELIKRRAVAGYPLTEDDKLMIKIIRQEAIDRTKMIQERLFEELEGS